jgi:alpha-methylacyl-CoA racemase
MNTGPLSGVKVIEIAGIGPGPFCGMLLADLGADVVRVDRPGGGGFALVPAAEDLLNRGKRSIIADLATPDGVQTVLSLVEHADILFEGFRPGVAERLGIGPEPCLHRRPQLVYGRMTGWGQEGPLARSAGHDIAYIAPTGALHAIGQAGGPPQIPLNLLGDFAGGSMYLVVGMLAALDEVRRGGRGQVVDAAIVDGTAHLMTMIYSCYAAGAWTDERGTNLGDGGTPFYGVYPTSDAKFMAVGALESQFYAEFLRRLGIAAQPNAQFDRATWPQLRIDITDAFAARTQREWMAIFGDSDACVAPVLGLADAPTHAHLAARGTFVVRDGVTQPAPAPRFSRTPAVLDGAPCIPGEHTDEVLAEWLNETIARHALR